MTAFEWISTLGIAATVAAVGLAVRQLAEGRRQARTQFEDSMSREYRDLVQTVPTKALLGEALSDTEFAGAFDELYRYVDLSNEQVFLRQKGRVSEDAWENWAAGMRSNLALPAFRRAWAEIKEKAPGSFAELRRLEAEGFDVDPATWG